MNKSADFQEINSDLNVEINNLRSENLILQNKIIEKDKIIEQITSAYNQQVDSHFNIVNDLVNLDKLVKETKKPFVEKQDLFEPQALMMILALVSLVAALYIFFSTNSNNDLNQGKDQNINQINSIDSKK